MNQRPGTWNTHLVRGVSLGLWVLAGGAFLLRALFPGSAGGTALAPMVLAAAVAVTGFAAESPDKRPTSARAKRRTFTVLLGFVLALFISLTIINEGDRRSFVFVTVTALLVAVLSWRHEPGARQ